MTRTRKGKSILSAASRGALQWRLLLLWLLAQALPLALACLPLWTALTAQLSYSLGARRLTSPQGDASIYLQVVQWLVGQHELAALSGGWLVMALQLPWLAGVTMTAASSGERLPIRSLIVGGVDYYWRMARLGLWSLLVLGLFAAGGGALVHLANGHADELILEVEADLLRYLALALTLALCVLTQACTDAARARLLTEPQRRSVVRAFFRSCAWLLRRPSVLGIYLLLTAAGLLSAALLAWLRLRWPANTPVALLGAFILGQALVLSLAMMRAARSFALVAALRATHVELPLLAAEARVEAAMTEEEPPRAHSSGCVP